MKLHATISILSTMLLMGLHGATSPDNCRDKAHMDTMTTGVLCNYFIMLRTSVHCAVVSFSGYLWTCSVECWLYICTRSWCLESLACPRWISPKGDNKDLSYLKKNQTIQTVKVWGARHTYGVFNPLSVLSEVSHQALHVAFCFLHTTDIKTFRRILILKNKAAHAWNLMILLSPTCFTTWEALWAIRYSAASMALRMFVTLTWKALRPVMSAEENTRSDWTS